MPEEHCVVAAPPDGKVCAPSAVVAGTWSTTDEFTVFWFEDWNNVQPAETRKQPRTMHESARKGMDEVRVIRSFVTGDSI